jgi:hypothetical protein
VLAFNFYLDLQATPVILTPACTTSKTAHTHTHTNTRTYKHTHTHTRTQTYKLTYLIHLKCAAAGTYCTGVATHYLMLLPLTTTALFNFFAVVEKRVFFFTIVRQLHRADPTELLCLFVYVCA